jgi:hypothetical protein
MIEKFEIQDCTFKKTYKIYAIIVNGVFKYIGITKTTVKYRIQGHLSDNIKIQDLSNRFDKIHVIILCDYNSKLIASVAEKVLIMFIHKHVNPDLINLKRYINEDAILSQKRANCEKTY